MHRLKTYIDGNQFKMYSLEEKENADNYNGWYQEPPSPTYKDSREDRMRLSRLGHASYLHFDA